MNSLLHTLQPPAYLASVHARLGQQLSSTLHTSVTPADEIEDEPRTATAADFAVAVTKTRTYRPKGKTLDVLIALRDRGPMTSAELATVARVKAKHVWRFLDVPVAHGIVRRINGRPTLWELT